MTRRFDIEADPLRSARPSAASAEHGLIPLAPLTACRSRTPKFAWKGRLPGDSIVLDVFRRGEKIWSSQAASDKAAYPEDAPFLERGAVYYYTLAVPGESKSPRSKAGPFFFTVMSGEELARLNESLRRLDDSKPSAAVHDFFKALILAEARVDGEALPLLESLATRGQGGAAVLMMIASIQAAAQDEAGRRATLDRLAGGS